MKTGLKCLLAGFSLSLIAACGGGGSDSTASTAPVSTSTPTPSTPAPSPAVTPAPTALASGYPGAPVNCNASTQTSWLRDYMDENYYWYDKQGVPNAAASTMSSYFSSLLYKPVDRYSYVQTTDSFTQLFVEGKRTGYGYSLTSTAPGTLAVLYTEPQSPVGLAGLKRGDNIISINGLSAATILTNGLPGVSEAGITRSFVVSNAQGTRSFSVLSAEFALSPVLTSKILTATGGRNVGYLAYTSFLSTSKDGLVAAINSFRQAAVKDVILDMRYNGGGSTAVAQNLTLLLGGSDLSGQVFSKYQFNNKLSQYNFNQNFTTTPYTTPLSGLTRLFVITAEGTASASEMVINGLKPYRSVTTIGTTSYGKPYAFSPIDACGLTYNAVNLQILNAKGFGDYANGIPADCSASDDISHQLGDAAETRTAAALRLISGGSCASPSASTSASQKITSSTPGSVTLGENGLPQPIAPAAFFDQR